MTEIGGGYENQVYSILQRQLKRFVLRSNEVNQNESPAELADVVNRLIARFVV